MNVDRRQKRDAEIVEAPSEPSEAVLNRLLRYSELRPLESSTSSATRQGGVVVPNGLPFNYLPNDLVNLIVQARGPRSDEPMELRRLARQRRTFAEGHSMKWKHVTTGRTVDLSRVNREWWQYFEQQFNAINLHRSKHISCIMSYQQVEAYKPRSATDFRRNEWLAFQDFNTFWQKREQLPAFLNRDYLLQCNCLRLRIYNDVRPVNALEDLLNWLPVLMLLHSMTKDLLDPNNGFAAHIDKHGRELQLNFFGHDLVQAASRQSLFDANQALRQIVSNSSSNVRLSDEEENWRQQVSTYSADCLFPMFTLWNKYRASEDMVDEQFAQFQEKFKFWSVMKQLLIANWKQYQLNCSLQKVDMRADVYDARSSNSLLNVRESTRQCLELWSNHDRIWLRTTGSFDTRGSCLIGRGYSAKAEFESFVNSSYDWNVVKIVISFGEQSIDWSDQQLIEHESIIKMFMIFPQFLQLSDEQLSVVITKHLRSEPSLTILLYSDRYIAAARAAYDHRQRQNGQVNASSDEPTIASTTQQLLANLRRFRARRPRPDGDEAEDDYNYLRINVS